VRRASPTALEGTDALRLWRVAFLKAVQGPNSRPNFEVAPLHESRRSMSGATPVRRPKRQLIWVKAAPFARDCNCPHSWEWYDALIMKGGFTPHTGPHEDGLTRLDLIGILAALFLIVLLAAPGLAIDRRASDRAVCFNNLRQIGQAFLIWGASHDDQAPFRVPEPVGTQHVGPGYKLGSAWEESIFLREELGMPRVLACPADHRTQPAIDWGDDSAYGFARLQDRAVSYFVGLEVHPGESQAVLSGDHNLETFGFGNCSSGVPVGRLLGISGRPGTGAPWTNAVHGIVGHLLFNDGSARLLSSEGSRSFLSKSATDNGTLHALLPIK